MTPRKFKRKRPRKSLPLKWQGRKALVVGAMFLTGCSADWYKQDADRQVYSILAERKQETLKYQPQAVAETTEKQQEPTAKSFKKVPVTPVPPPQIPPMEPRKIMTSFARLSPTPEQAHGPQPLPTEVAATQPTVKGGPFGIDAAERQARQQLRLSPPGAESEPLRLGLFDSIRYGVANGRDYQTQMESLYLAALDVTLQRHLFEPRPFANASLNYADTRTRLSPAYNAALSATGKAGVTQQLPYGGNVTAQALVGFVDTLNDHLQDGQNAQVAISGSIPLLRGAGMINLEPLIQSERTLVYDVRAFEDYRRQFAVSVASQYFNLIALQKSVVNRRVNYNNLLKLTEQTQALYSVGRINFLGVQQALQAQLFAESDLVSSQQSYDAAVDQYKLLLGMPINLPLDIIGEQLDVASPDLEDTSPEKLAIEYRLSLKTAEDQIDDARRKVDVAKNELLPQVDLTGSALLGDPNNDHRFDFGHGHGFAAGISVDLPVDRVAERNDYRRSLITLQQATRNYASLRDQVIVQVRTAVRTIFSAQTNLTIQRRNTDLALRRLEYSYDLLKLGAAQSRDVVDAQQSLLSAEDGYEGALSNYQVAVLSYLQNTGTLRVDPDAGTLGIAMDRAVDRPKFPQNPTASLPVELDSLQLRP